MKKCKKNITKTFTNMEKYLRCLRKAEYGNETTN